MRRLVLVVAVLAAALALVFLDRSAPLEADDTTRQEAEPTDVASERAGADLEEVTAPEELPAEEEDRVGLAPGAPLHAKATVVDLDPERMLRGRAVTDTPLPADEELFVVLQVVPRKEGEADDPIARFFGDPEWKTVRREKVLADGSFELPRPRGVARIQVAIEGAYVIWGELDFEPGGERDPGDGRFELEFSLGAIVTLVLDGPTGDERASLEGRRVKLTSTGPSNSNANFIGQPYQLSGELDRRGRADLGAVRAYEWTMEDPAWEAATSLGLFRPEGRWRFEPEPSQRLEIRVPLIRGGALRGRVLDEGGAPVFRAEAEISVQRDRIAGGGSSAYRRTTDDTGSFEFLGLPGGPRELTVTAQGFVPVTMDHGQLEGASAGGTLDIELSRGHRLEVRLTTAGGVAASGVAVTLRTESGEPVRSLSTDGQGTVEFVGLEPGTYAVSAIGKRPAGKADPEQGAASFRRSGGGFLGSMGALDPEKERYWQARATVESRAGADAAPVELTLTEVPVVRGRVQGMPPGKSVVVSFIDLNSDMPRMAFRRAQRGGLAVDLETGAFAGVMPPGSYEAIASVQEGRPGSLGGASTESVTFEVDESDVDLLLRFPSSSGLAGRVVLSGGEPLPDVTVRLLRHTDFFLRSVGETRSDGTGGFAFTGVGVGRYLLSMRSTRYLAWNAESFEVTPAGAPPDLTLEAQPAGAVHILVTGEVDGEPRTRLVRADGRGTNARPIEGDPEWDGAYGPLMPGAYIAASGRDIPGGGTCLVRKRVDVEGGELTTVTLDVPAELPCRVEGRVMAAGRPVPELTVLLEDELGIVAVGQTDREGRYSLSSFEPGSATLVVGMSSWSRFQERTMEFGAGTSTAPDVVLPGGAIHGVMEDRRSMMTRSMPILRREGDDLSAPPFRRATGLSNGAFEFEFLPDGRYTVDVSGTQGAAAGWEPVTVEVAGGKTVHGVKLVPREK